MLVPAMVFDVNTEHEGILRCLHLAQCILPCRFQTRLNFTDRIFGISFLMASIMTIPHMNWVVVLKTCTVHSTSIAYLHPNLHVTHVKYQSIPSMNMQVSSMKRFV